MGWLKRKRRGKNVSAGSVFLIMLIPIVAITAILFIFGHLHLYVSWLLSLSVTSFFSFGIDKLLAKARKRRLPEADLLLISILGGFIGSFLAMVMFRHKIRKIHFWTIMIIALIIHCVVCYFLLLR